MFELFSYHLLQKKKLDIEKKKKLNHIMSSGVKRFVYISAADFGVINNLIRGYFQGKVLLLLLLLLLSSSWLIFKYLIGTSINLFAESN